MERWSRWEELKDAAWVLDMSLVLVATIAGGTILVLKLAGVF